MTATPVILRERARGDIDDAIAHYLREATESVVLSFIDVLQQAFSRLSEHPATGSLRYAHDLNLPGLRCWPLGAYPYVVFYVERSDHLDVWRVLHVKRDIPAFMTDPENG